MQVTPDMKSQHSRNVMAGLVQDEPGHDGIYRSPCRYPSKASLKLQRSSENKNARRFLRAQKSTLNIISHEFAPPSRVNSSRL
jgi:hypothetical protein